MANLHTAFLATLEGDSIMTTLLTGGLLDAEDFDPEGLSVDDVPRESDGVRAKPFGAVRWKQETATGPYKIGAMDESAEFYIYQNQGYSVIEQAITRAKQLLHDVYLTADDRAIAHISLTLISLGFPAVELGNLPCRFMRFSIIGIRE